MKTTISTLAALSLFAITSSYQYHTWEQNVDIRSPDDATMHFFVVMVPESSVQALKQKARQDGEEVGTVAETGVYVGQIISGVVGGDVASIFAGSTSFIPEPDVQQGVSTILANVAPTLNNVVKQWIGRVQTALGITTTLKPGSVIISNETRPSNGAVAGRPITANNAQGSKVTAQQLLQQQQLAQQQQEQVHSEQSYSKPETVPGTNILSGESLYRTTTVEPLPLINIYSGGDEDDENVKKVK